MRAISRKSQGSVFVGKALNGDGLRGEPLSIG